MRILCLLFLLAFAGVVGFFAYQNQQDITLRFWDGEGITVSFPLVAGAIYLLGMFSGWTVIAMVRRTVDRMIESPRARQ